MKVTTMAQKAREASLEFRKSSSTQREAALLNIAMILEKNLDRILAENRKDVDLAANLAAKGELTKADIDRLLLTRERMEQTIAGVRDIATQNEVLGVLHDRHTRPDGLRISRERIPLGVIGMIFESRPNVVVDGACLSIKSGNAILLKGGKEANFSNQILCDLIREAIASWIPKDVVQLLDSTDREGVREMITLKEYIDVLIPRGGQGLINYVYENARVPVVAHFKGLCHIYVHEDADIQQGLEICLNAKTSRPGVCNAMETLLVHQKTPPAFLKTLVEQLTAAKVEIRGCEKTKALFPHVKAATEEDFHTEYLDYKMSLKVVGSVDEAIAHIQKYGTHHTEGICATSPEIIAKFQQQVDASCVVINASTRFNDGGELGLGAELGISTSKIHAYGPMGAREMTTTRYIVEGQGHIRR